MKSQVYKCQDCLKDFTTKGNLIRHSKIHYSIKLSCPFCSKSFSRRNKLTGHIGKFHHIEENQNIRSKTENLIMKIDEIDKPEQFTVSIQNKTFDSSYFHIKITPTDEYDYAHFMNSEILKAYMDKLFSTILEYSNNSKYSYKIHPTIELAFERILTSDKENKIFSNPQILIMDSNFANKIINSLNSYIDLYNEHGSDWMIKHVNWFSLSINRYKKALSPGCTMPTPKGLLFKGVINVQNKDRLCIKYAILSSLYYNQVVDIENPDSYKKYLNEINLENIPLGFNISYMNMFENQNQHIRLNIFTFENNSINCIYRTKIY